MDLGSRLANLSLAEIASMLNTKQQEVLLASISVAARFIQQLQAEELQHQQLQQADDLHNQQPEDLQQHHLHQQRHLNNNSSNNHPHHHNNNSHHHQTHNNSNNNNNHTSISNNNSYVKQQHLPQAHTQTLHNQHPHTTDDDDEDDDDEEQDFKDDDLDHSHVHDQISDISFDDYSSSCPGETLLTIREFAEELKHRRKSIRLSQKGAAQSLRAFTGGDQPCTDAIIYHFENLQLEPDRAMQLIPLLKDWLDWAEKHRLNGKQLPMMSAVTKVPRERKRKVVLFNEKAKQHLEDAFLKNNHPDRYQLEVISKELNIPTRSIRKWFTNRRQRKRFAEKFLPVS